MTTSTGEAAEHVAELSTSAEVPLATAATAPRVLELDILRGIAILLVLGIHSPGTRGESGRLRALDIFIHRVGWSGVDLFFILSGFLIGGLLFGEIKKYGALDVRRFLLRRMLRIWPAYYVLLIFVVLRTAVESGGDLSKGWSLMWPAFFHIQNFIESDRPQLWSLAVEEHFYLALPLLLWFLTRRGRGATGLSLIPRICVAMSISCFALRILFALTTDIYVRQRTDFSFDALFFGVNLAYLRAFHPEALQRVTKHSRWVFSLVWILFLPAFINAASFWSERAHRVWQEIGFTGAYLAYALLLVCFVLGEPSAWTKRWLASRSARWIAVVGTSSYSIYVWHLDTTWWAYELTLSAGHKLGLPTEVTWVLHTAAYIAVAILSGIVLGHIIETPALRLRDRVFPSRTLPVAATAK